jgi:hypothetical protein
MAKKVNKKRDRKHPQIDINIEKLHLDASNPRLPKDVQGKSDAELLKCLYKGFNLDELADSMSQNGYFNEEPLVAIPRKLPSGLSNAEVDSKEFDDYIKDKTTEFTVVEGNRRLAAAKLIKDASLREKLNIKHWPEPDSNVISDLSILPAIVYRTRSEVIPYLGVRHIVGIQKWDSYAKARYVAGLIDRGQSLQDVEAQIGDKRGSARENYISYKLLEQSRDEFAYDTKAAENDFSLLILAIGQGNIKRYLGLPTRIKEVDPNAPVPKKEIGNLRNLMSWLFGDGKYLPVINESRDITNFLTHVVASPNAIKHLERTRKLEEAYDLSDGEEQMILRYLATVNSKMQTVLGMVHRHKTSDVLGEVEKCAETANQLLKRVKENQ